jgi:hypothetical protein
MFYLTMISQQKTYLHPTDQVCDNPDQAAHYHTLGPKLEVSSLDQALGWSGSKGSWKNVSSKSRSS